MGAQTVDSAGDRQALLEGVDGIWDHVEDLFLGTQDLPLLAVYIGEEGTGGHGGPSNGPEGHSRHFLGSSPQNPAPSG